MAMLKPEQILKAKDMKTELVHVPEWGGDVLVSVISGTKKDEYEMSLVDNKGKVNPKNIRAKLLVASCVNEDGSPLFTRDHIVALGAKSAAAIDRVFSVAQRLNAVNEEDVEELAKN
jgi:hypothetical protein